MDVWIKMKYKYTVEMQLSVKKSEMLSLVAARMEREDTMFRGYYVKQQTPKNEHPTREITWAHLNTTWQLLEAGNRWSIRKGWITPDTLGAMVLIKPHCSNYLPVLRECYYKKSQKANNNNNNL